MNPDIAEQAETVTTRVKLSGESWEIQTSLSVPTAPIRLRTMLPLVQSFADAVTGATAEAVEGQGLRISCRKGCGACCRQLVPVSEVEARHLAALVEAMPEPRRSRVRARFAEASRRLAEAGLLEALLRRRDWAEGESRSVGEAYFRQGIPCPFLEEESCSIHADRPIVCREYLVTSPAEHCAKPRADTVHRIRLPMKLWPALALFDDVGPEERYIRWVPLVLALDWAAEHPEEPAPQPGPELLRRFLNHLTAQDCAPLPPDDTVDTGAPPADPGTSPDPAGEGRIVSADAATSYDEIPYSSTPFFYTQPDCLATMATLHGMEPAPADHCRVLELGCGRGGNLIPMALSLPKSRFVGIDLSRNQVADGRRVIEALGLRNIELLPMSILDIDERFGRFDYIVCHGVYSWVPDEVRDKILAICRQNLAPQGVAYVSYNTYPGWYLRNVVRDMLVFHARGFADASSRIRQARAWLDLVSQTVQDGQGPYTTVLREETNILRCEADSYLFHEHLEEVNSPLYFHQFIDQATTHELQYLEEAEPASFKVPAEVMEKLRQTATDLIAGEQYLDFLRGRTFRRTLLCHKEVALKRPPDPHTLPRCHVTTRLSPKATNGESPPGKAEEFKTAKGSSLSTNNPILRAAFHYLYKAWPRAVPFEELWDAVLPRQGDAPSSAASPDLFTAPLLQCFQSGLVELHLRPPGFVLEVNERPLASPLARLQARDSARVTNLRHYTVELNDLDRQVLQHLDGNHDRSSLRATLADAIASEVPASHEGGLADPLEACLSRLSIKALLVG